MTNDNSQQKPSRWGRGVAMIYGAFVVLMIGVVIFSRFHRVDLVASDYYDREVKYQSQIDRMIRRDSLDAHIALEYRPSEKAVRLVFPRTFPSRIVAGQIEFFRPSDASLDRTIPIALDTTGGQIVDVSRLRSGNWKLLINWSADTLTFYEEIAVFLE